MRIGLIHAMIRCAVYLQAIAFAWCLPSAAMADPAEDFRAGNEAFWNGQLDDAAAAYRRVIADGVHNADVYFNLGTTEAEAGHLGEAIWAFEQALLLRPDDEDASHNVDLVRTQAIDEGLERAGDRRVILPGEDDLGTGLLTAVPPAGLAWMFAAGWGLLFGFLILLRRTRDGGGRTALAFAIVVFGLFALASGGLIAGRTLIVNRSLYGVVVANQTQVRAGPGQQYPGVVEVLSGVKVRLRGGGAEEGWVSVTLPDGTSGWLPQDQMRGLIRP